MKRSLLNLLGFKKKNLLNEAILTQQTFLQKLVDLISKKPSLIGVSNINSIDDIYSFLDKSYESSIKSRNNEHININGLNLSQEKHEFYVKYITDIEEKEQKRLKTIEAKKSKGLKLSDSDTKENVFDIDEFNKQWNIVDRLSFKEKNLALEIFKVVKLKDVLNINDVKIRKSAEEILINQLRNYMNVDGTGIEFRQILPLYDSIINYLNTKADVIVDDIIMLADLYMKKIYSSASEEEKKQIDLGNLNFDLLFDKTKFYQSFLIKYNIKKPDINDPNLCVKVYESDRVEIYFPKTNDMFNYIIRYFGGKVGWCTQTASTWFNYNKAHYLMILHDKLEEDTTKLVSLKIDFDGNIDYEATCDYYNDHMQYSTIQRLLSDSDESKISNFINNNKDLFDLTKNDYLNKVEVEKTINGLLEINNIEYLKQYMFNSINDDAIELEDNITIDILKRICEENSNIDLFIDILNDILADAFFLDINNDKFFNELYINFDDNIELKNKLIFDLLEKSSKRNTHAKYFILLYNIYGFNENNIITDNIDLFNKSLQQVFNTNNTMIFSRCVNILSNNIINEVSFDYDVLYKSTGFINYIKEDNFSFIFKKDNISKFVKDLFNKDKEKIINIIETHNENQETKIDINNINKTFIFKYLVDDIKISTFNIKDIIESKLVINNYDELFNNKTEEETEYNLIKYNMFSDIEIYNKYIKQLHVKNDNFLNIYYLIKAVVFDKIFNNNESIEINEELFKIIIKDFFPILIDVIATNNFDINAHLIYLKLFEYLNIDIKSFIKQEDIGSIYLSILHCRSNISHDILSNEKYIKYFKDIFSLFNEIMLFQIIQKLTDISQRSVVLKIFDLVDNVKIIKSLITNRVLFFKQKSKGFFDTIKLLSVLNNSKHSNILNEILNEILFSEIINDKNTYYDFYEQDIDLIEKLINNYLNIDDFNRRIIELNDESIDNIIENSSIFNCVFNKIVDLFNKNKKSIEKDVLYKILLKCNNNINNESINKLLYNFIVLDSSGNQELIKKFIFDIFKENENYFIKKTFRKQIKEFISESDVYLSQTIFMFENNNDIYLLKKYIKLLIN